MLRDLADIQAVLAANIHDRGLFQRDRRDLIRNIKDFLIARDEVDDRFMGCVALHIFPRGTAELLTLAVMPQFKKRGTGSRLVEAVEELARDRKIKSVLMVTLAPEYFRRLGYRLKPRFSMPGYFLSYKLGHVAAQNIWRWPGILFGNYKFLQKDF
jgi:N-acetylglutamate synthase-like GNAT family acetyltransferase